MRLEQATYRPGVGSVDAAGALRDVAAGTGRVCRACWELSYRPSRSRYLVIEVAGSSLHKDRELKGPLYAAAGIPEYWVVDLESRRVIVHRNPEGGAWRSRRSFGAKATLSLLRFPDVGVELRNVFGS